MSLACSGPAWLVTFVVLFLNHIESLGERHWSDRLRSRWCVCSRDWLLPLSLLPTTKAFPWSHLDFDFIFFPPNTCTKVSQKVLIKNYSVELYKKLEMVKWLGEKKWNLNSQQFINQHYNMTGSTQGVHGLGQLTKWLSQHCQTCSLLFAMLTCCDWLQTRFINSARQRLCLAVEWNHLGAPGYDGSTTSSSDNITNHNNKASSD